MKLDSAWKSNLQSSLFTSGVHLQETGFWEKTPVNRMAIPTGLRYSDPPLQHPVWWVSHGPTESRPSSLPHLPLFTGLLILETHWAWSHPKAFAPAVLSPSNELTSRSSSLRFFPHWDLSSVSLFWDQLSHQPTYSSPPPGSHCHSASLYFPMALSTIENPLIYWVSLVCLLHIFSDSREDGCGSVDHNCTHTAGLLQTDLPPDERGNHLNFFFFHLKAT